MIDSPESLTGRRPRSWGGEAALVVALLFGGAVVSFLALKSMRADGAQAHFYQVNFGPAVMMACGHGFTTASTEVTPPSLTEFLRLERDRFDCADLPVPLRTQPVTWNGTWYYLYGATALVWRMTGISWLALDLLAAALGGLALTAQYGVFRLATGRAVSVALALLLMLTPGTRMQLLFLRDYSKAPFVLLAIFLLGVMVLRPLSKRAVLGLAAAFGAVAGLGYGFRSDLLVMVPFGLVVIAVLLPGSWQLHWRRNLSAAAIALVSFLVVGTPPLRGLQTAGGCQFHYALLGLTSPFTHQMGLQAPGYVFGDHFLDTFIDLKVGDFANRTTQEPPPVLCSPDYDRVSGALFMGMASTFPADIVLRAYGSVVTILREGVTMSLPGASWPGIDLASRLTESITLRARLLGPIVTAVAVATAWNAAPRLGIALALFVLFLAGYPAIEFEQRHWFHLRFLPWWSAALVLTVLARERRWDWQWARRGLVPIVAGIAVMAAALALVRTVQHQRVRALIEAMLVLPTEPLPLSALSNASIAVDWQPAMFDTPPHYRASDLLVATVDTEGCGSARDLDLTVRYTADVPTHDMTTTVKVRRGTPGSGATRLFLPVFEQRLYTLTYMKFAALEVAAADASCISQVARVTDRAQVPLWVQMQVPPDWAGQPLQQSFR